MRRSQVAIVPIDISIPARNKAFGVQDLEITHKPSGEAGQGNYTTLLKWTGITKEIRDLNLVGLRLNLYGPAPATTQPFFIEIVEPNAP